MLARFALRDRLAIVFAFALVAIYTLIGVGAVFVVHRAVSSSIDGRLQAVADAIRVFVDVEKDGRFRPDARDRAQFGTISADVTGALVIDRSGAFVIGSTSAVPAFVEHRLRSGGEGPFSTSIGEMHVRATVVRFEPAPGVPATIVVWQSLDLARYVERVTGIVLLAFGIILAVVGFVIGAQIARRGLAPLTRMTAIVADIEAHDLALRLGTQPHDDELGRLAATFDRMLDRLEAAFRRQRQFTADASHDLRAPLATLRAEADLALRRERSTEEYRAAMTAIAHDADRLDALIDALLADARSEAGEIATEATDLASIARQSVDRIAAFARAKQIAIDAKLAADARITADPALLERAVLAVLHNAVKYSPDHATIHVAVTAEDGSACLRIRDEGPGFSEAALAHAFERFWRDDAARGRGGSGLGLAIAKTIVGRCGGTVTLANDPNGGGAVEAIFPRSS